MHFHLRIVLCELAFVKRKLIILRNIDDLQSVQFVVLYPLCRFDQLIFPLINTGEDEVR